MMQPPFPPSCPNTCASQMGGGVTPAPQSPSHLSGSLHLNTEFKGLLRPPPDHESQMNPRIKDPLPNTPAPPAASRPCSMGRSPLFPHLEMLIHFVRGPDLAAMLFQRERPPRWIRRENYLNMAAVTWPSASPEESKARVCLTCWCLPPPPEPGRVKGDVGRRKGAREKRG